MIMKKVIPILIIVVLVAIGVFYFLTNENDNSKQNNNSSNSSSETMKKEADQSSNTQAQSTNMVTIKEMQFSPANISVKKGTTVTWTNQDSMAHTVTETDGKTGPDSGNLEKGQSYTFTFTSPGTYKYDCSIHTSMTGTVTVTE